MYLLKRCPEHGAERVLISTDAAFYKLQRESLKPGQLPLKFNTPIEHGCPYDCGLCPDHEQHSCLSLVEITDQCNLTCPVCYADRRPRARRTARSSRSSSCSIAWSRTKASPTSCRSPAASRRSIRSCCEILDAAQRRPIKHLMLNTNGIRIAQQRAASPSSSPRSCPASRSTCSSTRSSAEPYQHPARRRTCSRPSRKAIERLNEHNFSTTLVTTLKKGVNDDELGDIVDFALQAALRSRRDVPADPGRRPQSGLRPGDATGSRSAKCASACSRSTRCSRRDDLIPVPCHPDCLAMGYALKIDGEVVPLSGRIDPQALLRAEHSTIVYERSDVMRNHLIELFSTAQFAGRRRPTGWGSCCAACRKIDLRGGLTYENVFRVLFLKFLDPHDFDVRSVKRSCIHIVHPDGRIIPFDTYNLFYRDAREQRLTTLAPHQRQSARAARRNQRRYLTSRPRGSLQSGPCTTAQKPAMQLIGRSPGPGGQQSAAVAQRSLTLAHFGMSELHLPIGSVPNSSSVFSGT